MADLSLPKKSTTDRSSMISTTTPTEALPVPGALRLAVTVLQGLAPGLLAAVGERLFLRTRRFPVPARETRALEAARTQRLETSVGSLPVWVWGEEGPAVVLVHGWEGRGSQLGPFAEPLVAAGFRVVAYDAPGHGAAPGGSSSLVLMAKALSEVVGRVERAWGPAAAVVAHSAGAVAATYAVALGLPVERLVYVAPGADLLAYSRRFARALGMSEALRRRLQERLERRIGVAWSEIEPVERAPEMTAPLLAFADRDDPESPLPTVEALIRAWPGAELEVTSGLGHRRILRNPEVIGRAVEFLAD
jgi:pimeloyl-ACP methyl ester carboxylesterase